MPLSLSFPTHRAGASRLPELLHVACCSHSKCSINRCDDGQSQPATFQEAQDRLLSPPHCLPGQRRALLLLQKERGPCQMPSPPPFPYPSVLVVQPTILL